TRAAALDDRPREAGTVAAIEPGRAANQPARRRVLLQQPLAQQLRAAVGGKRIGRIVSAVGPRAFAIKDEVSAEVNEERAGLLAGAGKSTDRLAVDGICLFGFVL